MVSPPSPVPEPRPSMRCAVLRIAGALCAIAALVVVLRAGHPELTTGPADSTWAPEGVRSLATPAGLLGLALAAAAIGLLTAAARPGRRASPRTFFDAAERRAITEAIAAAESRTAGEIRVHVERRTAGEPLEAARRVFVEIGMTRTAARTGVLVYLSVEDHAFAIVGDEGIDRVVPPDFWEEIRARMAARFGEGRFAPGVVEAVAQVGEKLRLHFPVPPGDRDELSNALSIEDEAPRVD